MEDIHAGNIRLQILLEALEAEQQLIRVIGPEDRSITGIEHDSRRVSDNYCFVALRGRSVDGHLFIDKAVRNGATVLIGERWPEEFELPKSATFLEVADSRMALADAAAAFYQFPGRRLKLIGVTGTNGKTTTVTLAHQMLTRLGWQVGTIGTVEWRIGQETRAASHTTPDALELQRLMHQMVEAGCTALVMEVSSHALEQQRVRGMNFDAALFTNLSHEHLDYHGTLNAYMNAKKQLFDNLAVESCALYNIDDRFGEAMVQDTRAKRFSFGRSEKADFKVRIVEKGILKTVLEIDGEQRSFNLVGTFNALNVTGAYGIGRVMGFGKAEVLDALAAARQAPGRFERVNLGNGIVAIVDYAHTPDALENVLEALREIRPETGRIWCVFGCGGDRDKEKRPLMGSLAERLADRIVVTSDNPRTEPPGQILDDIRKGMKHPGNATWIVDRREAIRFAVSHAREGDIVLIAGKGHEPYQIIGTEKRHFDDRQEVREAYRLRGST